MKIEPKEVLSCEQNAHKLEIGQIFYKLAQYKNLD